MSHLYSVAVAISVLFSSCTFPIPEPRYSPPAKEVMSSKPLPVTKQRLPDGWADITSRSKLPQIKLWLVNQDFSATMVLRQFQTDSTALKLLSNEEMNRVATISLHLKVNGNDPDKRVTRVPSIIDMKRNISSYVYTEKGLLRRVVVFKKDDTFLELELFQERNDAPFDPMTNDLVAFATMLYGQ